MALKVNSEILKTMVPSSSVDMTRAMTAEATFSKLPETKWQQRRCMF